MIIPVAQSAECRRQLIGHTIVSDERKIAFLSPLPACTITLLTQKYQLIPEISE